MSSASNNSRYCTKTSSSTPDRGSAAGSCQVCHVYMSARRLLAATDWSGKDQSGADAHLDTCCHHCIREGQSWPPPAIHSAMWLFGGFFRGPCGVRALIVPARE
jgi:hypothetical protein